MTDAPSRSAIPLPEPFAFATGIESSAPLVLGRDGRVRRYDQLERCFHYQRWEEDLELVADLGIRVLRYGPPYHRTHLGPDRYDWSFTDDVFARLRSLDIEPIVDLCHFAVPDWVDGFQDAGWPDVFAEYAGTFARRYPWVRLYTPVNEMFVCAKLSGLLGLWNERQRTERGFVTALKHQVLANLAAVRAILRERPDAWFIQSESAEYVHEGSRDEECRRLAAFENQRRFMSLDLLLGHPVEADIRGFLGDQGMTDGEYAALMAPDPARERIVVGLDFYRRNEQIVVEGGRIEPSGDIFGWAVIAHQYFERYGRPMMHTETNNIGGGEGEAPAWLWRQFLNVWRMRDDGVPVIGFTWYSLIDQLDWDVAMADDRGMVNPIGLFDLDRRERPVGRAYRDLIREYRSPVGDRRTSAPR